MPRNFSRKTTMLSYIADLEKALNAIKNCDKIIREAEIYFKISESTLRKKLRENEHRPLRLERKPICTEELESELNEYVLL